MVTQAYNIGGGKRWEIPDRERWLIEWWKRPAKYTDEQWAERWDDLGPDALEDCFAERATKAKAVAFAKTILSESYWGAATVTLERFTVVDHDRGTPLGHWESISDSIEVD